MVRPGGVEDITLVLVHRLYRYREDDSGACYLHIVNPVTIDVVVCLGFQIVELCHFHVRSQYIDILCVLIKTNHQLEGVLISDGSNESITPRWEENPKSQETQVDLLLVSVTYM